MSWLTTDLCTPADLYSRWALLDEFQVDYDAADAAIARAKEDIGDQLKAEMRHFVLEYDLDADADVRDMITNPTVFKKANIALAIFYILQDRSVSADDLEGVHMRSFKSEYMEQIKLAKALMIIDTDKDDEVSQTEASENRGKARLWRA